jgi:hypothetical protein
VTNISFVSYFKRIVTKDQGFANWIKVFPSISKGILCMSSVFSFKIIRLFISGFLGSNLFKANFDNIEKFLRPMNFTSVFNIFFTCIPLILTDFVGLALLNWGTQLYISLIETLLITLVILFVSICEFRQMKQLVIDDDESPYGLVGGLSHSPGPINTMPDASERIDDIFLSKLQRDNLENEKRLRHDALKSIIQVVKSKNGPFCSENRKIGECIDENEGDTSLDIPRTRSLPKGSVTHQYDNEITRCHSMPASPKSFGEPEAQEDSAEYIWNTEACKYPDNVYA